MERDDQQFWLNILLTLYRWKKFIIVTVFVTSLVVAGISLLLPNWYKGKAALLPPESQKQAFNLSNFVPSIIGAMELPVMASPSDVIASMAQSRAVIDSVIRAQNLMELYDTDKFDLAVKEFRSRLDVNVLDNGIIEIGYLSRNPERAAAVTNNLIEVLDHVNRNVTVTKARNTRSFIEGRLVQVEALLRTAEDSLVMFQSQHQAIALDEQTKAQIGILADLEGERTLTEVERDILSKTLSPNHPEVRKAAEKVAELTRQIDDLEFGTDSVSSNYLLRRPLVQIPDLAVELARLMRSVKTQETVYELLLGQLEQAKIEESKTTSTISVLDYASVPELKDHPKRSRLVLLAALLSLSFCLLWIWLIEYLLIVKASDPSRFGKLRMLLEGIWLPRVSKRLRGILKQ